MLLVAGVIPFVATGILGYRTASNALKRQAFDQLVSVRESKKKQVEDYFSGIRKQIRTFSGNRMIVDAMKEFKMAFEEFREENSTSVSQLEEYRSELKTYYEGDFTDKYKLQNIGQSPNAVSFLNRIDEDSISLQYFYIKANLNKLGEKHKLDYADDNSAYSRLHAQYHPIIRDYLEQFGYYDIFLVAPDSGDIVYSVFKELDFSTSLKDGPFAETNFGRVFRDANNTSNPNYIRLIDFEPYPPSYEDAASFIASPIFDGNKKVGVLIFQMPIDKINMVMTSNYDWNSVGLGETGETYLIGDDFMMRNQSRFLIEDSESYFEQVKRLGMNLDLLNTIKAKKSTILLQAVRTKGSEEALSGKTNIEIFPDYRNVSVLSAYAPLNIEDVKWAIMSEIDEDEALKPVIELTNNVLIVAGISSILVVVAIILSTRIIKPIKTLIEGTKRVASGDLEHVIKIGKSDDELKELCESFNLMMKELSNTTNENKQLFSQVKRSRDELDVKAKELEKTYNELEDFVYIVSHDLKEPLFSIEGFRSRLLRSTKNTLDEKSKLHLERIKANVEIMSKKISEIMEVLKVGRVVYNFERHNVNTIVGDVLRMLETKTTENNVNVVSQDNMPAKLKCDRERLKDVFSNLIINAVKFMGDDKAPSTGDSKNHLSDSKNHLSDSKNHLSDSKNHLSDSENQHKDGKGGLKEIRIGCKSNGNYYKFFVEDTGIGIRPEYRDLIFKIFRRLNDIETEGSGVGLAIVKKIIEIHEGNIWVESPIKEGRGSRFCFTIPMSKERES